jgi:inner membrane protein
MSRLREDPVRIAGTAAGVAALDVVQKARTWPMPVVAALDWPAHVATATLVLAAAPRLLPPDTAAWALVGSVAIDIDHAPLYLGVEGLSLTPDGRPVTHSLATSAALAVAAALTRGRTRTALGGLSIGTLLHFVRDLGTGPGVPLLWPLSRRTVRIPYAGYLLPVAGAALVRALAGRARAAA